jgi:hypothetical protein
LLDYPPWGSQGMSEEVGGLVVRKDAGERHVFKVPAPKTSLLGVHQQ